MNIKRICVMSDITRCKNGQPGILLWLGGMMEGIVSRICDTPFYTFTKEELRDLHLSLYGAYKLDLSKNEMRYNFLSVPKSCWVDLCFEEPNQAVLDLVCKYFKDTLVISREPSVILKKAFDILNIPYIDLAIHSVRYMDDLIMGATTNIPEVYEKLKNYELNEEEFYFYADLLKAEYRFRNSLPDYIGPDVNYAIFMAQTPVDISLLDFKNKRLATFHDYIDRFENLVKTHDKVFYKPHPFYEDSETIKMIKSYPNTKIVKEQINIYQMLSQPEYKTCASISSGTIKEAYYFGKNTECYLRQPYTYSEEYKDKSLLTKDIYVTIGKHWMASAFWADILQPIIDTRDVYRIDVNNVHNKLRRILNKSWGFIDSDSTWANSNINCMKEYVESKGKNSIRKTLRKLLALCN